MSGTEGTPPANNEVPAWAQKELSDIRSEAAARRVEARDYKEKLDASLGQVQTLTTEKDQAVSRAEKAELELLKVQVAVESGIPGGDIAEFVAYLQGSNKDELKDNAGPLIPRYTKSSPAYDPSQGHGGQAAQTGAVTYAPDSPEGQWLGFVGRLTGETIS